MGQGSGRDKSRRPMWMQDAVELGVSTAPASRQPEPVQPPQATGCVSFGLPAEPVGAWLEEEPRHPSFTVTPEGHVFDDEPYCVGVITADGDVRCNTGEPAGHVREDGTVWRHDGLPAGHIAADGTVWAADGRYVGWVDPPNMFAAATLLLHFLPYSLRYGH